MSDIENDCNLDTGDPDQGSTSTRKRTIEESLRAAKKLKFLGSTESSSQSDEEQEDFFEDNPPIPSEVGFASDVDHDQNVREWLEKAQLYQGVGSSQDSSDSSFPTHFDSQLEENYNTDEDDDDEEPINAEEEEAIRKKFQDAPIICRRITVRYDENSSLSGDDDDRDEFLAELAELSQDNWEADIFPSQTSQSDSQASRSGGRPSGILRYFEKLSPTKSGIQNSNNFQSTNTFSKNDDEKKCLDTEVFHFVTKMEARQYRINMGHDLHFSGYINGGLSFQDQWQLPGDSSTSVLENVDEKKSEEDSRQMSDEYDESDDEDLPIDEKAYETLRNIQENKRLTDGGDECTTAGKTVLPASLTRIIFNNITVEDGLGHIQLESDDGWLPALKAIGLCMNPFRIFNLEVLHRVMMDGMRYHHDKIVRRAAFATLLHCINTHRPGPGRYSANTYFLLLLTGDRRNLKQGRALDVHLWEFVLECVEAPPVSEDICYGEAFLEGNILALTFITTVIEHDFNQYYSFLLDGKILDPKTTKPMWANALFGDTGKCRWNRRCSQLCTIYLNSLENGSPEPKISCLRKLVGIAAQMLMLEEKGQPHNYNKLQMSEVLATWLYKSTDVDPASIQAELFLLDPSWLSYTVSSLWLTRMKNIQLKGNEVTLRDLVEQFINVKFNTVPRDTSSQGSTSKSSCSKTSDSSVPSPKPSKIKVNSRNKFGETPLHTACKRGNLARIQECLKSPGVDINAGDNLGFTPLHEAVTAGKLEAVKLLLRYASRTLTSFLRYSSSLEGPDKTKPGSKATNRVNLLVLAGEEGSKYSPLHEAAEGNRLDIMREIFDYVSQMAGTRAEKEFPTQQEMLDHTTSNGKSLIDLASSDDMKQLLTETAAKIKPLSDVECLNGDWLETDLFRVLLENCIQRYVSAHSVARKFHLFKFCYQNEGVHSPRKIKAALENKTEVNLSEALEKRGTYDFSIAFAPPHSLDGYHINHQGVTEARDIRDFEKLRFFRKKLCEIQPLHPIMQTLCLLGSIPPVSNDQQGTTSKVEQES